MFDHIPKHMDVHAYFPSGPLLTRIRRPSRRLNVHKAEWMPSAISDTGRSAARITISPSFDALFNGSGTEHRNLRGLATLLFALVALFFLIQQPAILLHFSLVLELFILELFLKFKLSIKDDKR